MAAPFAYLKGTFVDSAGTPRNGAVVSFRPLQTPLTLGGDIVSSDILYVTLNASGQFGFAGTTKFIAGYYRVVVSDVDAFDILVPNDSALHDIKDLGIKAGTSASLTQSGVDPAMLALTLNGGTTVDVSRSGDLSDGATRILLWGDSSATYVQACKELVAAAAPDYVIGINLNPGGLLSTLEANVAYTFGPYIKDYSGPSGTGPIDQRFFYVLGGNEYAAPGSNFADMKTFFQMPGNYYTAVVGNTTFFFLSSENGAEPAGVTYGSTQGLWFQAAVAAATTKFKVVVFGRSPVAAASSYNTNATWMDWPFASLGIDLVVTAGTGTSEHRVHNGVPMLIVGGMADTLATIDQPPSPYANTGAHTVWTLEINDQRIEMRELSMGDLTGSDAYPTEYTTNKAAVKAVPHYIHGTYSSGVVTSAVNGSINNGTFFPGITNFVVGDRILAPFLYDSPTLGSNITHGYAGIYQITNLGSAGTPFVLTRATDLDTTTEANGAVVDCATTGHFSSGSRWKQFATITTFGSSAQRWERIRKITGPVTPTLTAVKMAIGHEMLVNTGFYNSGTGVLINNSSAASINDAAYAGGQGVTLVVGDRVLVIGPAPSPAAQPHQFPGVYTVTTLGGGTNFTLTRATDANTNAELTNAVVYVQQGYFAGKYFIQTETPNLAGSGAIRWDIITSGVALFDMSDPDFTPGVIFYANTVGSAAGARINLAVRLKKGAGIKMYPQTPTDPAELPSGGIGLDYGNAPGQVYDGKATFLGIQSSRVVRYATAPSVGILREKGYDKDCLLLVGSNPTVLMALDKASASLVTLATGPATSTLTQLAVPTFTPDDLFSSRYAVSVDHVDPLVTLMVSINGGDFAPKTDWPNNKIIEWDNKRPSWIAAYVYRAGYQDSEIVTYNCSY